MKSIELTQSQIKAYETGATMFLFPINQALRNFYSDLRDDMKHIASIESKFPIQKGDKDNLLGECIDVRVVRVKETENTECYDEYSKFLHKVLGLKRGGYSQCIFEDFYNQQMKEQNINRTYDNNDYIFLVEVKR